VIGRTSIDSIDLPQCQADPSLAVRPRHIVLPDGLTRLGQLRTGPVRARTASDSFITRSSFSPAGVLHSAAVQVLHPDRHGRPVDFGELFILKTNERAPRRLLAAVPSSRLGVATVDRCECRHHTDASVSVTGRGVDDGRAVESGDDRKGVELGRASARSLFGDHQGVSAQDDVLTTGGQWKAAMIEEGWPRLSQLKQFIEMAVQTCLQTGNSRGPTRMSEDRLTTIGPG
jgi:hypothetical protein